MPTPALAIVERIAAAILTALQTYAGHDSTGAELAVRPSAAGDNFSLQHGLILLDQGDGSRSPEYESYDSYAWSQAFTVAILLRQADVGAGAVATEVNAAVAAVQVVLTATPQWGGIALDTDLTSVVLFDLVGAEGLTGAEISFDVVYRVKKTDPTTNS